MNACSFDCDVFVLMKTAVVWIFLKSLAKALAKKTYMRYNTKVI